MKVTKYRGIEGCCEDCGFYNDCPIDYLCPAADILKFFMEEQDKGRLRIIVKDELQKEIEEQEE